jgi:gluconate kinase
MPLSLLDSQFATLEPPLNALTYSIEHTSAEIAEQAAELLRGRYAVL